MAIQVDVPKDLSGIKQKIVFNLTGRQLFSFGLAGIVGIPFYLFTKNILVALAEVMRATSSALTPFISAIFSQTWLT